MMHPPARRLEWAIRVFRENKRNGVNWPEIAEPVAVRENLDGGTRPRPYRSC
jgi:hypothetical protein